jgi:hypothetical protein
MGWDGMGWDGMGCKILRSVCVLRKVALRMISDNLCK